MGSVIKDGLLLSWKYVFFYLQIVMILIYHGPNRHIPERVGNNWFKHFVIPQKTTSGYDGVLHVNQERYWLDFLHTYFKIYWLESLKIQLHCINTFYRIIWKVNLCFFDHLVYSKCDRELRLSLLLIQVMWNRLLGKTNYLKSLNLKK